MSTQRKRIAANLRRAAQRCADGYFGEGLSTSAYIFWLGFREKAYVDDKDERSMALLFAAICAEEGL
jgi:hypothetical protein